MKQGAIELIGFVGSIACFAGMFVFIAGADGNMLLMALGGGLFLTGFPLAAMGAWDLPARH